MPVSNRLMRQARSSQSVISAEEYEILDPNHLPDLNGEFAGSRVYRRGLMQVVKLLPSQAKFYLDQGSIRKVE